MRLPPLLVAAIGCFTAALGQEEEQAALMHSGEAQVKPLNVAIIGIHADLKYIVMC